MGRRGVEVFLLFLRLGFSFVVFEEVVIVVLFLGIFI